MRGTTPPSARALEAEVRFRIRTEEVFGFHSVCTIVPESVGSALDYVFGESEHLHPLRFRDGVGSHPHPVAESEFK